MSFEQTTIFYNLVNAFMIYGAEIRNEAERKEKAQMYASRFVKMYGADKIQKVKAKANQKLKAKIF